MDVEINAYGKLVRLTDMECETSTDCTEVAFELWNRLEKPLTSEADDPPTLEAAGGGHVERTYLPMGYSYMSDGERLNVK